MKLANNKQRMDWLKCPKIKVPLHEVSHRMEIDSETVLRALMSYDKSARLEKRLKWYKSRYNAMKKELKMLGGHTL